MPHQDEHDVRTNLQALKAIFEDLLPPETEQFVRHGNATISPTSLAAVAIVCWGWTNNTTLDERIGWAAAIVKRVFRIDKVGTRQGVMKALASCGDALIHLIVEHFATRLHDLKGCWSSDGVVNFAVDGTKFAAPRTKANQHRFAAQSNTKQRKRYKKKADQSKASTVQLLVTVVWHIGSGLPFRWLVNGSKGSEPKHLSEMLDDLPGNARLIGDAAYIGYPLWKAIIDSRRLFLVRVGSNVKLLKGLGSLRFRDGHVYYWPDSSLRRSQPPLVLRLFTVHNGKETIYLVTNELSMSDAQGCQLYKERWGIEVFFRAVKQSCQRSKLRCHTPGNILTEVNWTLIGIWAALYVGKRTLHEQKHPISRLSPVKVIRAFQRTVHAVVLLAQRADLLFEQLAQALIVDESGRTTSKQNRNYPRKKQHRSCGKPNIVTATAYQKQQAKLHLK